MVSVVERVSAALWCFWVRDWNVTVKLWLFLLVPKRLTVYKEILVIHSVAPNTNCQLKAGIQLIAHITKLRRQITSGGMLKKRISSALYRVRTAAVVEFHLSSLPLRSQAESDRLFQGLLDTTMSFLGTGPVTHFLKPSILCQVPLYESNILKRHSSFFFFCCSLKFCCYSD